MNRPITVYYARIDLGKQSQIVTLLRRAAMCGFQLRHFAGWEPSEIGDEKHPGPRYQESMENAAHIQRLWDLCSAHIPAHICPIIQTRCVPMGPNKAAHGALALDPDFHFSEDGYDYAGCPKDVVDIISRETSDES